MTNAEKYLKDEVDVWKLANEIKTYSEKTIQFMPFNIEAFFKQQVKPTLTEDERVILEFIKNFDYIGRDKKGLYYKLQDEDIKEKAAVIYNLTTSLFQFIKERRRI